MCISGFEWLGSCVVLAMLKRSPKYFCFILLLCYASVLWFTYTFAFLCNKMIIQTVLKLLYAFSFIFFVYPPFHAFFVIHCVQLLSVGLEMEHNLNVNNMELLSNMHHQGGAGAGGIVCLEGLQNRIQFSQ